MVMCTLARFLPPGRLRSPEKVLGVDLKATKP